MRLILVTSVALSLLLTASVSAALVTGRILPAGALALLRFDSCPPPCWVGIEPGKTTVNEAVEHLKAVFSDDFQIRSRTIISRNSPYNAEVEVTLTRRAAPAFSVSVELEAWDYDAPLRVLTFSFYGSGQADFSLHALMSILGTPSDVVVRRYNSVNLRRLTLIRYTEEYAARGVMIVTAVRNRLDGWQKPYRVEFFDFGRYASPRFWNSYYTPWQGMASLDVYAPFRRRN